MFEHFLNLNLNKMKKLGESMNISREEKNQNRSFVFKVPGAGNRSKEDIKN
jgi:hypothetical protein